jgi:hypothetical protein
VGILFNVENARHGRNLAALDVMQEMTQFFHD